MAKSHENNDVWEDIGDIGARRRASKSLGERSKRPSAVACNSGNVPNRGSSSSPPVDPIQVRQALSKRKREEPTGGLFPTLFPATSGPSNNVELPTSKPVQSTRVSELLFNSMRSRPEGSKKKPSSSSVPQSGLGTQASAPVHSKRSASAISSGISQQKKLKTSLADQQAAALTAAAMQQPESPSQPKDPCFVQSASDQYQTDLFSLSNLGGNEQELSTFLEGIPTAAELAGSALWGDSSDGC